MDPTILLAILAVSVISCALVSGVFLAFSEVVMTSLRKAETAAGIEVMQIVNREVFRTLFMVLLVGMSFVSVVLIVLGWITWQGASSGWMIAGGLIYLLITFGVTIAGNVPLNVKLDRLPYSTSQTETFWFETFYGPWVFFNHVRTLGAGVASCCFLLACLTLETSY